MTMIHHDEYKGSRWRYASRYRPFGYGTCPPGWIVGSDSGQTKEWRYGTRDWPHRLDSVVADHLDLVLVEMILTPLDALREIADGAPTEEPVEGILDDNCDAAAMREHWRLAKIARSAMRAAGIEVT